jgi:type I restriction enzyme S subunit
MSTVGQIEKRDHLGTDLTALEARRDKTRALKQGMMQELLTGRIRLV